MTPYYYFLSNTKSSNIIMVAKSHLPQFSDVQQKRAECWMYETFPNCKRVDVNYTFKRFKFPDFVKNWIMNGGWIKESDKNGGTYRRQAYKKSNKYYIY